LSFDDLIRQLEAALSRELPGAAAQARMAPRPRREWPAGMPMRQAASLLLLIPHAGSAAVVLTLRAAGLERHSGQVSMPGGVIEPSETAADAAVREAHEEIGLDPRLVRVLGALTPIDIPVSGFRLHPIVAAAEPLSPLVPDPREVARVLTVPLADLRDHSRVVWRTVRQNDREFEFPCLPFEDVEIWGATAMALAEFLAIIDTPRA
jgi:8-oxo-dGTP pyrophosphatase MutT (NUDIX family)